MDKSNENVSEKRKIEESFESVPTVKMDIGQLLDLSRTTPGPKRKKFKKQKKDVEKSPLMLFNETFPSVEFNLERASGPSHQPEFVMSVVCEGVKFESCARSKKEAKQIAAENVLRSKGLWPMQHVKKEVSDNIDGSPLPQSVTQKKQSREETIIEAVTSGKNPVSITHEYHSDARFTIVGETGRAHCKIFTCELILNGKTYQGTGSSKKAANASAAAKALLELYGVIHCTNNKDVSDPTDLEFLVPQPLADKIGEMIHQKFAHLSETSGDPTIKRKVLAGIVKTVQKGEEVVEMDVISLGTGTKCITGENISNAGQALNDCHGEVIARRGLCHYLFEQLDLAMKGKAKVSCFSKKKNGLFTLKEGIAFHLYISTSPCGDGRIFSPKEKAVVEPGDRHPQRKTRGLLRTKIENGEGTLPVRVGGVLQTWDGVLQGERLLTMSCSDKISKWNVVGVQGALLSHFIEPIYLTSVVLGSLYNFHHLTRALYKRLGVLTDLPDPYRHNYHLVNCISLPEPRAAGKSPSYSLNWSWGNDTLESVNASSGKLENGEASRLCKDCFFRKFLAAWRKVKRSVSEPSTYHEAKQSAENYRRASLALKKEYEAKQLGKWVDKPVEQDDF